MKLRYPVRSPIRSAISGVHDRRHESRTLAQIIQGISSPDAYYDAGVIGSLWKDVAGTVPVTMNGDLVARMDDLSGTVHVMQATEALRPVYDDTWGGRLLFSGAQSLSSTVNFDPLGSTRINMIAGVRKLSDSAIGYAMALMTTTSLTQSGMAFLRAPGNIADNLLFLARGGGAQATATAASIAAPATAVMSGFSDIATPVTRIRVNGTQRAESTATLGTGTFMPHLVHIGARGGTVDFFSGYFQSGILIGGALADANRNAIESILRSRIGV